MRKNIRHTFFGVVAMVLVCLGVAGLVVVFILTQPAKLPADLPPETASTPITSSVEPSTQTSSVGVTSPSSVGSTTAAATPTPTPTVVVPTSPSASAPKSVVSPPASLCDGVVGTPQRVTIAALGVNARIEELRANPIADGIGDPDDKLKMGWQAKYPGVKPGACKGTILMDAHTYHDGSAVFKVSYNGVPMAQVNKLGMVVKVATNKGDFYYRIDWQKTVTVEDYPRYAAAHDIYDVERKQPERIFFATCSGWNGARFATETMFAGHRIPPP